MGVGIERGLNIGIHVFQLEYWGAAEFHLKYRGPFFDFRRYVSLRYGCYCVVIYLVSYAVIPSANYFHSWLVKI